MCIAESDMTEQLSVRTHTHTHMKSASWWLSGKESTCQAGDLGVIPGSGRAPGERISNPLQYSCLGNTMNREPGRLQSMGLQRAEHNLVTKQQQHIHGRC